MKIFFKIISLLISISIGIFAFAQNPFSELYKSYDIESGKQGGKLILSITSDPKSFNPIVAQETSTTQITSYIFEGLTRTDPLSLEVLPNLAKSWKTEDGKVWIFNLRRDVYWNDGVKFTSKDVVFTFEDLIYNPNIPNSSKDTFTLEGKQIKVEAIDSYKVKFTLPFIFSPFLRALSQDILPFHKYASLVKEGKFSFGLSLDSKPDYIVGTGPFCLDRYLPGERVVLKRNKFYYKKDSQQKKLPYLDKIIFVILPNADTALLKFLEQETDYYALRPQDLGILGPLQKKNNFKIYNSGPTFGSNFLVLNQNGGINPITKKSFVEPYKLKWFRNKLFREAIAYAINREKIIDVLMNGLGTAQYSPVSQANAYYHTEDIKKYPFDSQKAKDILIALGFSDKNNDGIFEDKEGNRIEISLFTNANDTQRIQIATLIKKDLEAIGIKINFLPLDFNNLVSKLTAVFDWEMILIGLTGGIEPYFGKNVWSYKGNLHMWNPSKRPIFAYEEKIEGIFNTASKTLDDEKRKDLYASWQRIASEELPLIYTVTPNAIYAVRNRFGNLYPTVYGGAFSQIEYIYIKDSQ